MLFACFSLPLLPKNLCFMEMKLRIQQILSAINQGVYEKETEISLSLLAALAGESVLLLGPPGVAKSMVARRLKQAFAGANAFEYLMSRFSTPDEIFGPVSISLLKEQDKYERRTEGYLPTADVVFLDEIWKAGPAIQNTLLTVINEKLFRNGDHELSLPLKLLIAASNELPAQGEGLEALWDRFLIRLVCTCIKQEDAFYRMLLDESDEQTADNTPKPWQITAEEYAGWQQAIKRIGVPAEVLACLTLIRKSLKSMLIEETEVRRDVYVSDRRWKNIVRLLKASAFMHDRSEVSLSDILPIYHCLWNEPGEREEIRRQLVKALFAAREKELKALSSALKADLKVSRVRQALEEARRKNDHRDDKLAIVDHFYYQLEGHRTGNTFIFIVDYRTLTTSKEQPARGVLYADPFNPKQTILRTFEDGGNMAGENVERVTLYRDDLFIYINGVRYGMRQLKPGEQQQLCLDNLPVSNRNYDEELEALARRMQEEVRAFSENLFLSEEDKECVAVHAATLKKGIAWARVDVRKLQYGDE